MKAARGMELEELLLAYEYETRLQDSLGRICIRSDAEEHMSEDDWKSAAMCLGYDRNYDGSLREPVFLTEEETLPTRAGLVPVLTTQKRRSKPPIPFRVSAQATAAREHLSAFALDVEARRINHLRMHVGYAARSHCVEQPKGMECLMVTLTYRESNDDWQAGHIRAFMDHIRKWFGRHLKDIKCQYVWVAELQKRGVIHYHVALWVPEGVRLPKPDECGWWPHGMTRIEVARAAVPYLLKYLSKDASKTLGSFPRGARIYGVGGLSHVMRRARRWLGLPAFVQGCSDINDDWRRAPGGGWTSPGGTHYPSEFECVLVAGKRTIRRVRKHARWIEASGPFSWINPPAAVLAGC